MLGGERLFARHLFAGRLSSDEAYFENVLRATDPLFSDADRRDFEQAGAVIPAFLDSCFASTDWSQYEIVGFTVTFQQMLAALAPARRIKEAHPQITICLGGAGCEGAMGQEILRQFSQVDLVFSGEADETFPAVVRQILGGQPIEPWSGVFARGGTASEPQERPKVVLDDLPYPDCDDYFERLGRSPLRAEIEPVLLFESARGCWWGAKSQCTFCGLNGGAIAFRSKSPERAVRELRFLTERYAVHKVCATDNILDHRYYRSFLPLVRAAGLDLELEYELKTNMTRTQADDLVAAGLARPSLASRPCPRPSCDGCARA